MVVIPEDMRDDERVILVRQMFKDSAMLKDEDFQKAVKVGGASFGLEKLEHLISNL